MLSNLSGAQDEGKTSTIASLQNTVVDSVRDDASAHERTGSGGWTKDGVLELDTTVKWKPGRKKTHRIPGRRGRPPKDPRKRDVLQMQQRAAAGPSEPRPERSSEGRQRSEDGESDTEPDIALAVGRSRKRKASRDGEARRSVRLAESRREPWSVPDAVSQGNVGGSVEYSESEAVERYLLENTPSPRGTLGSDADERRHTNDTTMNT